MNIGARLEAIAALVPQNCVVADIGTDHAAKLRCGRYWHGPRVFAGVAYAERLN